MIADEIKKAGQATIDQSTDLLTYKLTDTWETYSGSNEKLAALACDTGGSYWYHGDYNEWSITFTQDVCRYKGTPVKYYDYDVWGSGDDSAFTVTDFSGNQLYYSGDWPADADFTVRQIEFQNGKQSFQILSSGQPSYTDSYYDTDEYSEERLLNTSYVPSKDSCGCTYNRYLTSVGYQQTKTLRTIYAGPSCVMVMVNAVQSNNYDWTSASYPAAGGAVKMTIPGVTEREAQFNYYNPGNLMMILQPHQTATVTVKAYPQSGQTTTVLCTIQEIAL